MQRLSSGRVAAAVVSLCLALAASGASASEPVLPGDPGGGWTIGGHGTPNQTSKDGNATGGSVTQNSDGTSSATMNYTTPNDGSNWTGTYTVTSYDADGNQVAQATSTVSDTGNGGLMLVGYDEMNVPVGGSVLIRLNESNGHGGWFTAGFRLINFQP